MKTPLVSVITLNWNCSNQTSDLIRAFQKQTYPNIEIVVVDNGSAKNDFENLQGKITKFKNAQIIRSEKNLGYAGGMNFASKFASGKYLLVIVADVLPAKNLVETLMDTLEMERITAVSPLVLAVNGAIRYGGASIKWHGHAFRKFSGAKINTTNLLKLEWPIETEFFSGTCFMIRRKDFLNTKFDSTYFAWWEDVELSLHLKNKIKTSRFLFVPYVSVTENGISPTI